MTSTSHLHRLCVCARFGEPGPSRLVDPGLLPGRVLRSGRVGFEYRLAHQKSTSAWRRAKRDENATRWSFTHRASRVSMEAERPDPDQVTAGCKGVDDLAIDAAPTRARAKSNESTLLSTRRHRCLLSVWTRSAAE